MSARVRSGWTLILAAAIGAIPAILVTTLVGSDSATSVAEAGADEDAAGVAAAQRKEPVQEQAQEQAQAVAPTPGATPVPLRGGNATVYVRDFQRSVEFYRDILGFDVPYVFPPGGEPQYATMTRLDMFLGLATFDAVRGASRLPLDKRARAAHPFEIVVIFPTFDAVDAAVDKVRAAGLKVVIEPENTPWGDRRAYVLDPDGNYIQLSTDSRD